ncbi:MAG: hypothetical protein K2G65_03460 [Eubacterium sp.]|nr:hypothetical protein [Eubacterium sp.]
MKKLMSLLIAMTMAIVMFIPVSYAYAGDIDTTEMPTYDEAESVSVDFLGGIFPKIKIGELSDELLNKSELTVGDKFSFTVIQDMPSLEQYEQKWINTIDDAYIYFPLNDSFDYEFKVTDQYGNDVTDEAGSYYFETKEYSSDEYIEMLKEQERSIQEEIENETPQAIENYKEFIKLERDFDQMVIDAKAELYENYVNGDITEEEYAEYSEELEQTINEMANYLKECREFYDEAGVTGESDVYLAVAKRCELRNKYQYMLLTGYEYLPQRYSVFRYDYDSEYIKTHSGITLTLNWDVTVTERVPLGEFYFNPLLFNHAGMSGLSIEDKKLVWRGQKLWVMFYSPIYNDAVPDNNELLLYKLYKEVLPGVVIVRNK